MPLRTLRIQPPGRFQFRYWPLLQNETIAIRVRLAVIIASRYFFGQELPVRARVLGADRNGLPLVRPKGQTTQRHAAFWWFPVLVRHHGSPQQNGDAYISRTLSASLAAGRKAKGIRESLTHCLTPNLPFTQSLADCSVYEIRHVALRR